MIISVTQEDIDHGERKSCSLCPVARAMSRAFGEPVECGFDSFFGREVHSSLFGRIPDRVGLAIRCFDRDGLMIPFEFTVEGREELKTL